MADTPEEAEQPRRKLTKAAEKARQIKEVKTKLSNLSPVATAEVVNDVVVEKARRQLGGFTDFIREQGVVGVGIGLVIGIQIKAVVDTVMASFVNPVTELLLPGKEALSDREFTLSLFGKHAEIGWGAIAYSLFTFIMVALIVYAGYKLLKLDRLAKKKDK
jgi:large-conductance mechanosensitive channel